MKDLSEQRKVYARERTYNRVEKWRGGRHTGGGICGPTVLGRGRLGDHVRFGCNALRAATIEDHTTKSADISEEMKGICVDDGEQMKGLGSFLGCDTSEEEPDRIILVPASARFHRFLCKGWCK